MGWSGSLSESSAVGSAITYTPDTSGVGEYTVSAFTAPRKGVYRFVLSGSGGAHGRTDWGQSAAGGEGGKTTGYLLLEKGQTVYAGAGGPCSAAFVSAAYGASLAAIASANLHLVAGAGGQGGGCEGATPTAGANGGGESGAAPAYYGASAAGGGTQAAGGSGGYPPEWGGSGGTAGSYGTGGSAIYNNTNDKSGAGGRGGDGYYGGGSGAVCGGAFADGGAGGSGYVKTAQLTVGSKTYTSETVQGGGAASNTGGSVQVTYFARAELPVIFDGTAVERIIFNGTEITGLIFNGTRIFAQRLRGMLRRMARTGWMERGGAAVA